MIKIPFMLDRRREFEEDENISIRNMVVKKLGHISEKQFRLLVIK